jgi:hypothetical protein
MRLFATLAITSFLNACTTTPTTSPPRFDESKPLALPCLAEPEKVQDGWYVRIARNPVTNADEPEQFASGAFVARVSVWVTFAGEGQQLITVVVGSNDHRGSLNAGRISTGRMVTGKEIVSASPNRCEAFAPFRQADGGLCREAIQC